ncbi:MAG: hypothetical protein ACRCU5_07025 [Rhizobiaceae bacterium]
MSDIEKRAQALFKNVSEYVTASIEPLHKANADVCDRLENIEKLFKSGLDAIKSELSNQITSELNKKFSELPAPKDGIDGKDGAPGLNGKDGRDGIDGKDGKDGAPGLDGKDGAPGVDGKNGVDGKDGAPGLNGKDGVPGIDGKDGAPGLDGKDGRDGIDGKDGASGLDGKDGRDGIDGKDGASGLDGKDGAPGLNGKDGERGIGVKSAMIDKSGELVLVFEDGLTQKAGVVCGRDGIDGKDGAAGKDGKDGERGADGFGLDDFKVVQDDPHTAKFMFIRGEERRVSEINLYNNVYKGVFKEGDTYEIGNSVTWAGSVFVAKNQTTDKPGESENWQLAVKRGRDGKDGKNGEKGERGLEGKAGRDLTQMNFDGQKY